MLAMTTEGVGDVLLSAPDARGTPFWEDWVLGVISSYDTIEKAFDVRYEQEPWHPKQQGAREHKSSKRIGSWRLDASESMFEISIEIDLINCAQQLGFPKGAATTLSNDALGRVEKLLKASVVTRAKRKRMKAVESERPSLSMRVQSSLQARLVEVKEELEGAHEEIDTYGPVVMQNQIHKEEIAALRELALKHGASQVDIDSIKLEFQRKLARSAASSLWQRIWVLGFGIWVLGSELCSLCFPRTHRHAPTSWTSSVPSCFGRARASLHSGA